MHLSISRPRRSAAFIIVAALAIAGILPGSAFAQQATDREFLRMMSNHHEGLVQMGRQAAQRAQDPQVRGLAQRLADEQAREQQEMLRILREHFRETHQPMVMPENRVQIEQLLRYQGAEYDREFLQLTIHHHNDGMMMIHLMRPRFAHQDVRAMANRMEEQQMREAREMEGMLGWPTEMADRMMELMMENRRMEGASRPGMPVQKDN